MTNPPPISRCGYGETLRGRHRLQRVAEGIGLPTGFRVSPNVSGVWPALSEPHPATPAWVSRCLEACSETQQKAGGSLSAQSVSSQNGTLRAPAAGYPPSAMITQLLPGAGAPSESREKQPLPLPSLTLFQSKREGIILVFFFFPLLCDLQSRQPSTPGSSALSSVALTEEETWYYVVGVEIPNPQFQEQKEGASFLPAARGALGRSPLS